MAWSGRETDRVNILMGLTIPFMLRVVMVCVGGGQFGWIDGGEGERRSQPMSWSGRDQRVIVGLLPRWVGRL